MIPSRPSAQALTNTSAPSATRASLSKMQWTPATSGESAARRSSIGRLRKSLPLRPKSRSKKLRFMDKRLLWSSGGA
jgi:hypothetical protein